MEQAIHFFRVEKNELSAESAEIKSTSSGAKQDGKEPENVAGEELLNQKEELLNQTEEHQESNMKNPSEETERSDEDNKDNENKTRKPTNDEKKSVARKLFVHSQWLSAQSSYFKALFYSGMKETYSKEVVMKVYDHELEAHLVLIEAMYKLDVLNDKDYHLVVKVLILANKYDVSLVTKKCKYILMAATPSIEMCEYVLKQTEHLTKMDPVYDVLQTFLVKEFTPFDETWTTEKFTGLSKAALRLLLKSDDLATQSENMIFVALIKWVDQNLHHYLFTWDECDMLDVVRFEFMSIDFLYDVVRHDFWAKKMPGFTNYLQNGLAYHGFSEMRREQLEPKPKKRPTVKVSSPTFSWVIDENLKKKLLQSPEERVYSQPFWCQGYKMQLMLQFPDDGTTCEFYLRANNLKDKACLCVSYKAKSNLFRYQTIEMTKQLYTTSTRSWGKGNIACNKSVKGETIDVWVKIA